MSGTAVTGASVDEFVDLGDSENFSGWFCIATDPFLCPAPGCDVEVNHVASFHQIVVWPENDHPNLLRVADYAKREGRNPRVVEYETSMGPCVSYYDVVANRARGGHGSLWQRGES